MSLLEKSIREAEERDKQKIQSKDSKPTPVTKKSPKEPLIEKSIKSSKIDFNKISNRAYFQRFVQELIKDIMPEQFKGVDFKVSREVAVKRFDDKITEIERGSKGAFNLVVKELKEKLAKQKLGE